MEKDFAYFCDRKKCTVCSYPDCRHTTDINHAMNFKRDNSGRFCEVKANTTIKSSSDYWEMALKVEAELIRQWALMLGGSTEYSKESVCRIASSMQEYATSILKILNNEKE